jgi:hypothetical protein
MNIKNVSLDSLIKKLPMPIHDFIWYGFCGNTWCWAHGLAGAIWGGIGVLCGIPVWIVLVVALVVATAWEIFEFRYNKLPLYWILIYDAIGDVLAALFCCWIARI